MIGRNNPFNVRYDARHPHHGEQGHINGISNFVDLRSGFRAFLSVMTNYIMSGFVGYQDLTALWFDSDKVSEVNNLISLTVFSDFPFQPLILTRSDYYKIFLVFYNVLSGRSLRSKELRLFDSCFARYFDIKD